MVVTLGSDGPKYNFSVDKIACNITRSREIDMLYISLSVAIAGWALITTSKAPGDQAEGITYPNVPLPNIPIATFTYLITDNGNATESEVGKFIEDAVTKIATTGANAATQTIGTDSGAAGGAAIGALLGSSVPVLGTIVGAALGALSAKLLSAIIPLIITNCDGPIAAGTETISGTQLREMLNSGQPWSHQDNNPGIDSPSGCGRNSQYSTTWSISRAP